MRLGVTYHPVYASPLLNLYDRTSPIPFRDPRKVQDYRKLKLPNVERAVNETAVLLSHQHLLAERKYIDQILEGIEKVNNSLPAVKQLFARQQAKA